MKKKITFLLLSIVAAASAAHAGAACCGGGDMAKKTATPIGEDVVETAMSSDQFTTLVAAIEAAGLAEALKTADNITVFAPTNEAFEALPDGVLDMLLKPENKEVLVKILTYHVLPAEVPAADVAAGPANTLEGSPVEITVEDGSVKINEATVVQTDIEASNGVIHVIDQVLVPSSVEL
ncbi:MAG: fasciclin domain-containing protein [Puniceicoccaceae bacterium]